MVCPTILAVLAFALGVVPAMAGQAPGGGGVFLKPLVVQRPPETAPAPTPYPMTYSEQVAKRLGLGKDGVSLTGPRDRANPYAPSVSFNGSMLRLKWRP